MNTQTLKHVIRDISIWKMSVFGVAWLYRCIRERKGPLVRIVVFHDVPDASWFESMVRTLKETYTVITPEDFYKGNFDRRTINVLITFDDGYDSWVQVALPVLNAYAVKGLFFISSGLIDGAHDTRATEAFMNEKLRIHPRPALTWEGVRALQQSGHSIGGHARTHADLTTLTETACAEEIELDKRVIERTLGMALIDFAYPFGTERHVNDRVEAAVRHAGYARGYTALSAFARSSETFRIPRMCIESSLSPRMLRAWVGGGYDLFLMLKKLCVR